VEMCGESHDGFGVQWGDDAVGCANCLRTSWMFYGIGLKKWGLIWGRQYIAAGCFRVCR